jgi:hypothetical protein
MMLCKVRSVADAYRRLRYPLPPLYSRAVERLTTFTRRVWLYQPRVSEDAPLHTRCRMQLEVIGRDRATEGRWCVAAYVPLAPPARLHHTTSACMHACMHACVCLELPFPPTPPPLRPCVLKPSTT